MSKDSDKRTDCWAEIDRLEAELTALRKVAEIAKAMRFHQQKMIVEQMNPGSRLIHTDGAAHAANELDLALAEWRRSK